MLEFVGDVVPDGDEVVGLECPMNDIFFLAVILKEGRGELLVLL